MTKEQQKALETANRRKFVNNIAIVAMTDLVKKLNHKSIKEGIQMKQNRIFDQNSSQKARSWHYNMDTNRAEAQFADGSAIAIDCLAIEDEYGNTPAQRAELDWLLYNKPLECVQLVLSGEIEHYLSLGCDHGKLKD